MYTRDTFTGKIGDNIAPGATLRFNFEIHVPQCPGVNCAVPVTATCRERVSEGCPGNVYNDTKDFGLTGVKKSNVTGTGLPQPNGNGTAQPLQQNARGTPSAGQVGVRTFSGNISDVIVGGKYTMKATLNNDWDRTIKCSYKVRGTNYEEEPVTEGLNPGAKTDFNIVFFVPEGCTEPCSVTAHVTCYDKTAEIAAYETDVSFDLIGIIDQWQQMLGFAILAAMVVAIIAALYFAYRFIAGKAEGSHEEKDEGGRRKLSAIIFTDMKGYSREMGQDEEATLKKLWRYEKAMKQIIKEHEGHVVKTIGDAIMGDFDSAVQAVRAAMAIQDLLRKEDIKIRIGIHLGDVIHKGGDVFGDGVNIASRIESICEPGEIYISEDVYNQVKGKIHGDFQSLGRKPLKNIDVPPRVYRVK
ncbi:Adenylate and Guanylate cyclase catalytic domain protein [uncultured archaeon]|nr:Adenylate and Guanylate cyclase catalytic domain protein [uncultured archaeon]